MIKIVLRLLGLMLVADRLRYHLMKWGNRKSNRAFQKEYPDVVLPPDYLMYESFRIDYSRYYLNGRKTAEWLINLVKPYLAEPSLDILDWGCGPARIIRHMPDLLPGESGFSGSDYNKKSISWCKSYLKGIRFETNDLAPPLNFDDSSFDLVYGISIFTHLSEEAHKLWLNELFRVLRPKGVLFLTLHGQIFVSKLDKRETQLFDQGNLVTRGQVKEGHRTFIAFHPESFIQKWAEKFEVLNHTPGQVISGQAEQDVWIFRKP